MTSITAILSRGAPELVCQFVQEFFEADLRYGLAVAHSRGQEDLHEV